MTLLRFHLLANDKSSFPPTILFAHTPPNQSYQTLSTKPHLDNPSAQRVQSAQFHRACSSVGRALQSHCRGQGFESPQVHLDTMSSRQSHSLTKAMMGSNKPSSQRAGNSASPALVVPRRAHLAQLAPEPRRSATSNPRRPALVTRIEWMKHQGPVAQLGERHNGIVEVKGSSPFGSTARPYRQVSSTRVVPRRPLRP